MSGTRCKVPGSAKILAFLSPGWKVNIVVITIRTSSERNPRGVDYSPKNKLKNVSVASRLDRAGDVADSRRK